MEKFYVIKGDWNSHKMEAYDVIPPLVSAYKSSKVRPKSFPEVKDFVEKESMYRWWGRCEYEIILSFWPPVKDKEEKWDIYKQVQLNLDTITHLLMKSLKLEE